MNLSGHIWTIGSLLRRMALPPAAPPSERWTTTVQDSRSGTVRLSGRLSLPPGARDLVVLVHGLGGSSESTYLAQAAQAAWSMGLASLRLNLRGADGEAADFYHGGLTDDVAAAVRDLSDRFKRIFLLGYSLGGHVALRYATDVAEASLVSCAAVCSPLDLGAGADAIDRPSMALYRGYVLRNLKASFSPAVLARIETPPDALHKVSRLKEWDALTVVPRFGFRDTDDYYARASVGPLLSDLRRPALLVAAEHDPMVPPSAIRPHLEGEDTPAKLTVRWLRRGGHVALPQGVDLDLGEKGDEDGLSQILGWLRNAGEHRRCEETSP